MEVVSGCDTPSSPPTTLARKFTLALADVGRAGTVQRGALAHAGGMGSGPATVECSLAITQKVNQGLGPRDPETPGPVSTQEKQNLCPHRNLYVNIHSSIVS